MTKRVRKYSPGYYTSVDLRKIGAKTMCQVEVTGSGHYLPAYAGNLDIINCAALEVIKNYEISSFYDVTLRDGSHANKHSFTYEFCSRYIDKAYSSGLRYIEVGHGNGLGGKQPTYWTTKRSPLWDVIAEKTSIYQDLKIGVHVIPGLATFEDLNVASETGVTVFRIASHCTEADTTESVHEICSSARP